MERVTTKIEQILEPVDIPEQDENDHENRLCVGGEEKGNDLLDLDRTLSLVAPVPSKCVREIPNGVLKAWLQILGSFFLFFNTWLILLKHGHKIAFTNKQHRGFTNAFGVFEAYYSSGYLKTSPSDISIVGAVQAFFLLGSGLITGPLFDKGYFYHLLIIGSFLTCFGMMMTSLCTQYWQILLARMSLSTIVLCTASNETLEGICVGLGSGCLFVPSVAIIPTYFTSKRILAAGIASTGGSVGGIVYPIMF